MPLYNQATSLNTGRGNFAPSVTYYAGIKAPDQPAIHLPKANASFNIDLRPIGDAIIRTQELEIKKQDAEAERSFRQGLADQEDKRYRDLEALRDAREREFHTDEYNQRQRQLEIDEYKALSNYDIELRKLLREEEKDKVGAATDNDKKLANTLITKADEFIRKAYLRMEQDPSYTRETAQDDVYNYISNIESYYPDIVDPAKLADTASRYTFGFGGSKKAAEEAQYNEANAMENQYQTAKEQVPGLRNRPDPQARKMYQDTITQIDAYQRYKKIANNPYTTPETKEIAFSEMSKAGINMARLGSLNKIYEFATQEVKPGDYTNYSTLEASLRNGVVNSLASSMEYKDAQDYYNIAKERMGVNAFLESYNQYHKTNAEETDNITTDMLNTINGEYLFTIPAWRSYKALGGNVNSIVQTDPNFAKALGDQVLGVIRSNGVTYDEQTKTYTYQNQSFSIDQVVEAQRFFGVNDPYSAVTLAAIAQQRNMPKLVDMGLATEKDVNAATNASISLLTQPNQISTNEDARTVADNIDSAKLYETYLWCKNRTGTKDTAQLCMTTVQAYNMYFDEDLTNATRALANAKSSFGKEESVGYKLTGGNGIQLGFIDNHINISDDNFKVLNKYNDIINRKHSDATAEAKLMHLRTFYNLGNIKYCDSSYTGPFLTEPSETQKEYGKVFEADKRISQLHDDVQTPTADEAFNKFIENRRMNREIDKELETLSEERGEEARQVSLNNPDTVINVKTTSVGSDRIINVGIRTSDEKVVYINGERFIVPDGKSDEEILEDYKNGDLK